MTEQVLHYFGDITPGSEISVATLKNDLAQLATGPLPQEYKGMLTY